MTIQTLCWLSEVEVTTIYNYIANIRAFSFLKPARSPKQITAFAETKDEKTKERRIRKVRNFRI